MKVLLDTHVILWWLAGRRLAEPARAAIADPGNEVAVSAVSAWEISIKRSLGKLAAPDDLEDQLQAGGFSQMPIEVRHALYAGSLPRHHDDPFDRMLIAQATLERCTIATRDRRFAVYGVELLPS